MSSTEPLVLYRNTPTRLRRRPLEEFARILRERVAAGRAFCCLVTDDRELRRLNRRFLGHDDSTDVLSFPSTDPAGMGDLAISVQRAREQARAFGHSVEDEIRILMLHGVLHLAGMDHERDGGRMARAEAAWRRKLGLPPALTERMSA